jgi:hypothetical protein
MEGKMKKRLALCIFGKALALASLTLLTFGAALAQKQSSGISLSSLPYMEKGYKSLPVLVTSVTNDLKRGTIAIVAVKNNSSKDVDKLKLAWYLSTEEEPHVILQRGETPWLRIPDGIESGKTDWLEFDLVSFSAFEQSLVTNAAETKYLIRVGVSAVRYNDSATETLLAAQGRKELPKVKHIKATFSKEAATAQTNYCPNQRCEIVYEPGPPPRPIGHTCSDAGGTACQNTTNGQSCTNSICGSGGGGGSNPPKKPIID